MLSNAVESLSRVTIDIDITIANMILCRWQVRWPALIWTACRGYDQMVEVLVNAGATPDIQTQVSQIWLTISRNIL